MGVRVPEGMNMNTGITYINHTDNLLSGVLFIAHLGVPYF